MTKYRHAGLDLLVRHAGLDLLVRHAGLDLLVRHAGLDSLVRHAGLDPASSGILCRPPGDPLFDWIPAFAGMGSQAFADMACSV